MINALSTDTQAIILLYSGLGQPRNQPPQPLTISEYNQIALWLHNNELRPGDLFTTSVFEQLKQHFLSGKITPDRIFSLLSRGAALAISVDLWTNKGLWVITRSDEDYPARFKERLKNHAPPVLYGAGSKDLLSLGGLAIVGSRNVNDDGQWFSNRIAIACAKQGIQVISGGARGVDGEAMSSALDEGGKVVGVLANNLSRSVVSKKYREAIKDDKLVLISSFEPDAGFNVGNAMARNKYIYALSDWALVVDATLNRGGTWTGAMENIKKGWIPLFVRSGDNISDGNLKLISRGGIEMPENVKGSDDLRAWIEAEVGKKSKIVSAHQVDQLPLF